MSNVHFHLAEINRKATKKAVEKELEKLQLLWTTSPSEEVPSITTSYSLTPPTNTNLTNSAVESAAIENADREQARKKYIQSMINCINRLSPEERALIIMEYLDSRFKYNYEIFNELHVSESHFYNIKNRAYYKIALMLRIEVYKNEGALV